jgi:hypothetical protein
MSTVPFAPQGEVKGETVGVLCGQSTLYCGVSAFRNLASVGE